MRDDVDWLLLLLLLFLLPLLLLLLEGEAGWKPPPESLSSDSKDLKVFDLRSRLLVG